MTDNKEATAVVPWDAALAPRAAPETAISSLQSRPPSRIQTPAMDRTAFLGGSDKIVYAHTFSTGQALNGYNVLFLSLDPADETPRIFSSNLAGTQAIPQSAKSLHYGLDGLNQLKRTLSVQTPQRVITYDFLHGGIDDFLNYFSPEEFHRFVSQYSRVVVNAEKGHTGWERYSQIDNHVKLAILVAETKVNEQIASSDAKTLQQLKTSEITRTLEAVIDESMNSNPNLHGGQIERVMQYTYLAWLDKAMQSLVNASMGQVCDYAKELEDKGESIGALDSYLINSRPKLRKFMYTFTRGFANAAERLERKWADHVGSTDVTLRNHLANALMDLGVSIARLKETGMHQFAIPERVRHMAAGNVLRHVRETYPTLHPIALVAGLESYVGIPREMLRAPLERIYNNNDVKTFFDASRQDQDSCLDKAKRRYSLLIKETMNSIVTGGDYGNSTIRAAYMAPQFDHNLARTLLYKNGEPVENAFTRATQCFRVGQRMRVGIIGPTLDDKGALKPHDQYSLIHSTINSHAGNNLDLPTNDLGYSPIWEEVHDLMQKGDFHLIGKSDWFRMAHGHWFKSAEIARDLFDIRGEYGAKSEDEQRGLIQWIKDRLDPRDRMGFANQHLATGRSY